MSYATWNGQNIFTIKMVGTGAQVIQWIETLEYDFYEPKFGYDGELFDEYNEE